jgi:hypothetical protein
MMLIGKVRVGARLRKRYDVARTPYPRLRESRDLSLLDDNDNGSRPSTPSWLRLR